MRNGARSKCHPPLHPANPFILFFAQYASPTAASYCMSILTLHRISEESIPTTLLSLRTSCSLLLSLPPTPLLKECSHHIGNMDNTSLAVRGSWVANSFKVFQSYLQGRTDDPRGCKDGVITLLNTKNDQATGFALGAFIICEGSYPEIREEVDKEVMERKIMEVREPTGGGGVKSEEKEFLIFLSSP